LVAGAKFAEAAAIIDAHARAFWLDRDLLRRAQWELCSRMAELGGVATSILARIKNFNGSADAWIAAYTSANDAWYRVDRAHRRLETWVTSALDAEPDERAIGIVRRAYEDVCAVMAEGFTSAFAKSGWTARTSIHQTRVFSEVVAACPKPVAYFLVDAMRFEMGVELRDRLPKTSEVLLRHAVAALPTITPVGMAALLPGASTSFSVVEQDGKLGIQIDGAFLPDLTSRKRFASARVPTLVDMTLDEVLGLSSSKLAKELSGAQVVIVRSQDIDVAGETQSSFLARRVMDTVIDNLVRAIRRLATVGVGHAVVSADHGHLFASDRDTSMRIEAPGGQTIDLHRRCWVGHGGSTPGGCQRVSGATLGYACDLDFVFPAGCGVFKSGGDLAFHHGGASLQELIIPVLTVRTKVQESARSPAPGSVIVSGIPETITNRIFSVKLQGDLLSSDQVVLPLLVSDERPVGRVGMVLEGKFDPATGTVLLEPGKVVTVAFLLTDESATSLRIVVQDPATDRDLYRSSADIRIRLGT
jgi:hypothetical protein